MDIFHKEHVTSEAFRSAGRNAIKVGAPDPKDLSDELQVTIYRPNAGGNGQRRFTLAHVEVAELCQTLSDWLAEGWDGVVPVLEAERE